MNCSLRTIFGVLSAQFWGSASECEICRLVVCEIVPRRMPLSAQIISPRLYMEL